MYEEFEVLRVVMLRI